MTARPLGNSWECKAVSSRNSRLQSASRIPSPKWGPAQAGCVRAACSLRPDSIGMLLQQLLVYRRRRTSVQVSTPPKTPSLPLVASGRLQRNAAPRPFRSNDRHSGGAFSVSASYSYSGSVCREQGQIPRVGGCRRDDRSIPALPDWVVSCRFIDTARRQ